MVGDRSLGVEGMSAWRTIFTGHKSQRSRLAPERVTAWPAGCADVAHSQVVKSELSPCHGFFISAGVLSAADGEGRGAWAGAVGAVWQTPASLHCCQQQRGAVTAECRMQYTCCCCIGRAPAQ